MKSIKSTRLRFLRASTIEELLRWVEALPFRVELKGAPMKDGGSWIVFFVLPEEITLKGELIDGPGINLT